MLQEYIRRFKFAQKKEVLKMAEKKQHTIISASTGKEITKQVQASQSTKGLRLGAIILWIGAIICEIFAIGVLFETIIIPFLSSVAPLSQEIGFLVLDLILVIIGSQLWKKANHINPPSKKNPTLFWIWNNMGVIVCAFAFIPFIILLLTNKNVDKKTKTIGTAVAAIALIICGLASYDFNPVSAEDMIASGLGTGVYWTKHGSVFHSHEDCPSLNRSDELIHGSINEAKDAKKDRLCKRCEKRDANVIKPIEQNEKKALEKPAA